MRIVIRQCIFNKGALIKESESAVCRRRRQPITGPLALKATKFRKNREDASTSNEGRGVLCHGTRRSFPRAASASSTTAHGRPRLRLAVDCAAHHGC